MANKKYNSINDQAASAMRMNQNSLELLTKIDQAMSSSESYLTVNTTDASGNTVTSQIPTLGFLQQKLDQLMKYVQKLSGIDGNPAALQLTNNTFKRVITADLNNEPKAIGQVNKVSTFRTDPNWIFDSFLNPKISVELDLTGKIADSTRTIQSKRFIVEFDKIVTLNADGTEEVQLTTDGAIRLQEFNTNYKGNSNISMAEFVQWLDSPGVVNRTDDTLVDQDFFRIEPNLLQFKGDFSVMSMDIDTVNKKAWYILDTLTYYDVSDLSNAPKPIDLKIGDLITVSPNEEGVKSATIYKVVEISTITSEYRVRFERVFGEEPIPIKLDAIRFYSDRIPKRAVRISVGFDEYCVLFVKQVDDLSNIIGIDYSPGVGFYTSELRLDNDAGELFSDYYVRKVYDYGVALEDLVEKKTPNAYGIKPNPVVLSTENFKVVQINQHLTQTVEAEKIRDLHNQKNNIASQTVQLQTAIEGLNRQIQTTKFDSDADRKAASDRLIAQTSKLNNITETKNKLVAEILANKKNLNKIKPIYAVRGFFPMPVAAASTKTKPQEAVQFEVWTRRLSKSGDENPILTITDINNDAAKNSSPLNTNTLSNLSKPKKVNGAFSNWEKYRTDARKRQKDPITGEWLWEIIDVADASTPNINQIDISINPGEKIEIKVITLSEVGWPEAPLESDFSNILEIVFPDDLDSVLNEDDFILKEAQIDDLKVSMDRDLEARGLNIHLSSAIRDSDVYYAHRAETVTSGFTTPEGKIISLYEQLRLMMSKITSLEEAVNKAKGILEVYLINSGNKTKIFNGNNLTFNLNLEDFMTKTKIGLVSNPVDSSSRTYENELIRIDNYSIMIKNGAESANLGILAFKGYGQPNGLQPSTFAYDGTGPFGGRAIQGTFISPDGKFLTNNTTTNSALAITAAPQFATQKNNQFLWLQLKDVAGNQIYGAATTQGTNSFFPTSYVNGASAVHDLVKDATKNVGLLAGPGQSYVATGINAITDPTNWTVFEDPTSVAAIRGGMGSTIHPVIAGLDAITDTSAQLTRYIKPGDTEALTVPLQIFAKAFTGSACGEYPLSTGIFDDSAALPTGDMPALTGDIAKSTSGNWLRVEVSTTGTSSIPLFKVGDKVMINGFQHADTINANQKLYNITFVGATYIQINYSLPSGSTIGTSYAADGGSLAVIQLHKRYINSGLLYNYNVLGNIAGFPKYVGNYVEINSGTSPAPAVHTKKLNFFLQDENSSQPFTFQLTFVITQFKPLVISLSANSNINTQGLSLGGF
jgi:hypothetical protein